MLPLARPARRRAQDRADTAGDPARPGGHPDRPRERDAGDRRRRPSERADRSVHRHGRQGRAPGAPADEGHRPGRPLGARAVLALVLAPGASRAGAEAARRGADRPPDERGLARDPHDDLRRAFAAAGRAVREGRDLAPRDGPRARALGRRVGRPDGLGRVSGPARAARRAADRSRDGGDRHGSPWPAGDGPPGPARRRSPPGVVPPGPRVGAARADAPGGPRDHRPARA